MIPAQILYVFILNILWFSKNVSGQSIFSSQIFVDKANDDVSNAAFCVDGHEANSCNLRSAWLLCKSLSTPRVDCRIKFLPGLNYIYMNATIYIFKIWSRIKTCQRQLGFYQSPQSKPILSISFMVASIRCLFRLWWQVVVS